MKSKECFPEERRIQIGTFSENVDKYDPKIVEYHRVLLIAEMEIEGLYQKINEINKCSEKMLTIIEDIYKNSPCPKQ